MRIIGGTHSGRRLGSLTGSKTRPTGDRVREALFNIWQTRVAGAHFWDAYAGTGAVGLEALSRGAAQVMFSENHRQALKTLRHNIALMDAGEQTEVWPMAVEDLLERWDALPPRFDLIFLDPPWQEGISQRVRQRLVRVVACEGMAVVESRQDQPTVEIAGMNLLWSRRYGDTRLTAYEPDAEGEEKP